MIEADGKELVTENVGQERTGWESLDADQLREVFRENGLVEMSQDMLPLHWKAQDARRHKIHTLVLNACESEPYVTSDHSLFMSHPVEILKGAEIFRKAIAADKVIIAIQKDKLEVAELIKSKIYFLKWNNY